MENKEFISETSSIAYRIKRSIEMARKSFTDKDIKDNTMYLVYDDTCDELIKTPFKPELIDETDYFYKLAEAGGICYYMRHSDNKSCNAHEYACGNVKEIEWKGFSDTLRRIFLSQNNK